MEVLKMENSVLFFDDACRETYRLLKEEGLIKKENKEEKYITYKVHIVRDTETIDEITTKYNVSKEELEKYNDLNNIVLGTKIIIPISNEQ